MTSVHSLCTTLIFSNSNSSVPMNALNPLVGLFQKSFKRPSDLLCCAFGLRNSELDVYFSLISGPKTVEQIADKIGKDRSTVQRVLNKLHSKGLARRESQRIDRGGYFFEYSAVSSDVVREQILSQLEDWYQATRNFLLENWTQMPS
jgi:predicted transcriptional regulator